MSMLDGALHSMELAARARASFDVEAVITHLSTAIRRFGELGERRRAAMACVELGDVFANGVGNQTAARAWFSRAETMLEDESDCVEQGWVALAPLGCDVGDPEELLRRSQLALRRAKEFGDVDLETKALADGGLAHVQAGRVVEGMAMLDQAMALVCGPVDDEDVVGKSTCSFFTACYYSADFERAASWADLLRGRGLIGPGAGAALFLSNHCDAVQACLLCELGRWSDAEALLERASTEFERATGQPGFHPRIQLAELRIRQGRFADAEALLAGHEQTIDGLLPAARLHLHRGENELAMTVARRGLRALGSDHLRAMELLAVVVDAAIAQDDLTSAADACRQLDVRTAAAGNPILRARSAPSSANHLARSGDLAGAIELLDEAHLAVAGRAPYQSLRLLLASAGLRERAGDPASARLDALAALATLSEIDVVIGADDTALLHRLAGGPVERVATMIRRDKWWTVAMDGTEVRLRNTKGLRYLAELVAAPGAERHALDLVDRIEGVGDVPRRALGDAGEVIDDRARVAYRRRLETLRTRIDDALESGLLADAEAMQDEHDQLVQQLAQAYGLGGRGRRTSSAAERARVNVTRAIRSAIGTLTEVLPTAGVSLDRTIRTGAYCVHSPGEEEVRWIVHFEVNEEPPG